MNSGNGYHLHYKEMLMNTNLISLKTGEKSVFIDVQGGWGIIRRLEAMGIRAGVVITKISNQFLHGPVIIKVNNTQLAIGYHMARKIIVKKLEVGE
jgi:ferrous iron transport protein A